MGEKNLNIVISILSPESHSKQSESCLVSSLFILFHLPRLHSPACQIPQYLPDILHKEICMYCSHVLLPHRVHRNVKMQTQIFILLTLLLGLIKSKGCFQGMCNCEEDMAVCIDVVWVKFTYNPKIRILYLKEMEILDIHLVLENFPSLKYWTILDIMYFNCTWIKEIPVEIIVATNMCTDNVQKGEYIILCN